MNERKKEKYTENTYPEKEKKGKTKFKNQTNKR